MNVNSHLPLQLPRPSSTIGSSPSPANNPRTNIPSTTDTKTEPYSSSTQRPSQYTSETPKASDSANTTSRYEAQQKAVSIFRTAAASPQNQRAIGAYTDPAGFSVIKWWHASGC